MGKFLILAKDILHANRVVGDIVSVTSSKHKFSAYEDKRVWVSDGNSPESFPGLFMIVHIPAIPAKIRDRIHENHVRPVSVLEPQYLNRGIRNQGIAIGQDRWHFKLANLPPNKLKELLSTGHVKITYRPADIDNIILDRQNLDVFTTDNPRLV